MLEPDARKRARPVLRGSGRRKVLGLPCELVGNFRTGGQEWQPAGQPERVPVYDFLHWGIGKATPYGIYDLARNEG